MLLCVDTARGDNGVCHRFLDAGEERQSCKTVFPFGSWELLIVSLWDINSYMG